MKLIRLILLAVACWGLACHAQDRPLRLMIPMPPGASIDLVGRVLAERLRVSLGTTVVVENQGGAAGHIAAVAVKKAPPDGNTAFLVSMAIISLHPHTYKTLPYDPFADFAPVAHVIDGQIAFGINANVPANTLAEYLDLARRDPKFSNYGSSSAGGSLPHFFAIMIARGAKVDLTHIPYKGNAPMTQALTTGEISAGITGVQDIGRIARAGKAKLLGVAGARRSTQFPEVPTLREQGFDLEGAGWYGLYVPAKTPAASIDRLSRAVIEALRQPDVLKRMNEMLLEPTGLGPAELDRIGRRDFERWGPVVKSAGFAQSQ
jgi:tripartite-type tricarboxylate transporter receptor subunit TctC